VSSDLASRTNRERALLVTIPLLILQLIILSLQIEGPSGALLFKTWVLAAQAPAVALSSSITGGIRDLWKGYIWMVGARAENEKLREAVNRLLLANSAYEQIREENDRLRRLVSMTESLPSESVGARIIARTPGFLANVIYINRGSKDGLLVNEPVISGDGVVGRTVLVSARQSQVQLITNPDASVGVILESSRTPGVLKGTGDLLLDLNYINNSVPAAVGEIVLSSGLDGIFPKGLVIGKVVDSQKGKGVFRSITVEPAVDLVRLEEVSVLKGKPPNP